MLGVGSSRNLTLELFPFISLFLCVIGVLAFLQNLLVMGEIGASEEEAKQPQIFQTSYRIECYPDRIVLHPPDDQLSSLYDSLNLEEKAGVDAIRQRREFERAEKGLELSFAPEFPEDYLRIALNEVVTLNRLAKVNRYAYEEYVLLEIHPGGSNVYHYLLELLDRPEYRHVRTGLDLARLETLDSGRLQ